MYLARIADAVLAIGLSVVALTQLLLEEPPSYRVATVLGTTLPLAWRRQYPLAVQLIQVGFAIATLRRPVSVSLLALFVGLYSVAVYSRWRYGYLIPIIGAAVLAFVLPYSESPTLPNWVLELVGGLCVWFAGNSVRERQVRANALEERARQLERERELSTRVALAEERSRIARELHDVIAHSVSVMLVQAGAARRQLDHQPARAAEALHAIETTGREAVSELRQMLGLLTDGSAQAELEPQPGLAELDRLVERVNDAGLRTTVRIEGQARQLPAGLDLTAYRIVQEALTNALKYAAGAEAHVDVDYGESELRLTIVDGGGTRVEANGAGRGLLGMRERAAVYGGSLEAGPRAEGGFAVHARLPLP